MCFVDPRPSMFPEAKPRETSTVEGPQNTLLSRPIKHKKKATLTIDI